MSIPIRQYWNLLVKYLRPQWGQTALLGFLLLSSIGLQLINPQIMRSFIDIAQNKGPGALLYRNAVLFLGIALIQQVLSIFATYMGENVGWTATNALRLDLARHCPTLDMSIHNLHTPGEMHVFFSYHDASDGGAGNGALDENGKKHSAGLMLKDIP